jgi:hypothetical protein
MAKGGSLLTSIFTSGVGAYAAKNARNATGLVTNIALYALVAFIGLFVLGYVLRAFGLIEGFVPTFPSKEGDKKDVTPAGNVILY